MTRHPELQRASGGWDFDVAGTGFNGTFRIEIDEVPEDGEPKAL